MFRPEGVYAALPTPFDDKGKVNETELRRMVEWLVAKGVHGIFPLGSVGEFIHLSFEEKVLVMKTVVDQANDRITVLPGTGSSCADKCIALTEKARALGCQGAVISPPYYYSISQGMIEEHYRTVIRALPDFPIVLYNIPLFSTPISYDVIGKLSVLENVVGMKDSSGSMVDLMHYIEEIRSKGGQLNFLTGREDMLLPSLMMGAKGTFSGAVAVVPEIMTSIYQSWLQGDLTRAKELQFAVLPLIRLMFMLPFPLGFKEALAIRGFAMGEPKQPLSGKEKQNYLNSRTKLEQLLKQLLGDPVVELK